MADKLTGLEKKHRDPGIKDERRDARYIPKDSHTTLTLADAQPDGFTTADELRAELHTLYAHQLSAGQRAYRIRFELLSPADQAATAALRKAEKAAKALQP